MLPGRDRALRSSRLLWRQTVCHPAGMAPSRGKKDGGIAAAALGEIRNINQAASADGVAFSVAFA
jgi:hypothetical protein